MPNVRPVPEPSCILLVAIGGVLLLLRRSFPLAAAIEGLYLLSHAGPFFTFNTFQHFLTWSKIMKNNKLIWRAGKCLLLLASVIMLVSVFGSPAKSADLKVAVVELGYRHPTTFGF